MQFKNVRCNICNYVSHTEIASDHGDHYPGSFIKDPTMPGFICYDCANSIEEVRTDYNLMDQEDEDEI